MDQFRSPRKQGLFLYILTWDLARKNEEAKGIRYNKYLKLSIYIYIYIFICAVV